MQYNILQKLKVKFYCVFKKKEYSILASNIGTVGWKVFCNANDLDNMVRKMCANAQSNIFFSKVMVYYIEKNNDYLVGNI